MKKIHSGHCPVDRNRPAAGDPVSKRHPEMAGYPRVDHHYEQ